MEYLKGEKEKDAIYWMGKASDIAQRALCQNAKYGAVIVNNAEIVGEGYNAPPLDSEENRTCNQDFGPGKPKFDRTCCVHAEWRAVMDVFRKNPKKLKGSKIYVVKLDENGEIKKLGKPFCTVCSRLTLDVGISKFILWHHEGICEYSTKEYDKISYHYVHVV